jgi:hypothetical protein
VNNKCSPESQVGGTSKALGTRQRTRYVTSIKELSDDERDAVHTITQVMRRPRPGAPRQHMFKLTLSRERAAAKSLRLRDQLRDLMKRRGWIL